MEDRLEASFVARMVECTNVTISQMVHINYCSLFTRWKCFMFTKPISGDLTFWAPPTICTGHKDLFRVVPNKVCKDWVVSSPDTVAAHHGDPSFTMVIDWTQYTVHACME